QHGHRLGGGHGVVGEIAVDDAAVFDLKVFIQSPAYRLDAAAVGLPMNRVEVQGTAQIVGKKAVQQRDLAGFGVHLDLDRLGRERMGGRAVAVKVFIGLFGLRIPGFTDLQHFAPVAPDVLLGQVGKA